MVLIALALFLSVACGKSTDSYPSLPNAIDISVVAAARDSSGREFTVLGTTDSGIWVTSDSSEDWMTGTGIPADAAILDVVVAPDNATVFASTNSGLFRSDDSGRSWNRVVDQDLDPVDFLAVRDVSISPQFDQDRMLAVVAAGLEFDTSAFLSLDGGQTWDRVLDQTVDVQVVTGGVLATTTNRLAVVRDVLPLPINVPISQPGEFPLRRGCSLPVENSTNRATFSPVFSDDGIVFYAGMDGGTLKRLSLDYQADDNGGFCGRGESERIDSGIEVAVGAHLCASYLDWSFVDEEVWCQHKAAILSPGFASNGTGFVISTQGLFRTKDKGESWEPVNLPLENREEVRDVQFVQSDPERVLVATDQRIFVSDDLGERFRL